MGDERAEVTTWHHAPLEGAFGHAYGVFRFAGQARTGAKARAWAVVLKVIGPAEGSHDPVAHDYWKREALAYASGLLDSLPGGLAAPRCLGVVEQPDQETWIWLEDVAEPEPAWPLERYGLAARHLGRFNGAYLTGWPLPDVPWLSTGPLRARVAMGEPGVPELRRLSRHPLFEGLMPGDSLDRCLALWAARERLMARIDALPRALCHNDAVRRNLAARQDAEGSPQTVALDWAAMGTGPLGAEIGPLFRGLSFDVIGPDRIPDLDTIIFEGYVQGLRDAGWRGDRRLARFGYTAAAALSSIADKGVKWPRVVAYAESLPPDAEPPRLLNPGGPAQALAEWRHLLTMGEEALALLEALS